MGNAVSLLLVWDVHLGKESCVVLTDSATLLFVQTKKTGGTEECHLIFASVFCSF